jgi:hypothetical protein
MPAKKSFLNTEIGERVNQPDFQHAAEVSQRDGLAQIGDLLGVGYYRSELTHIPRSLVLHGFAVTNPSGNIVRVTKDAGGVQGAAIMAARERGQVVYGLVASEGDATRDVDITSYPAAIYGVFLRLDFRDDDFKNRPFWNATAATPVEFPRNIPTRRSENWSVVIELSAPGPEWMRVATVNRTGMVVTNTRQHFFEPPNPVGDYVVGDSHWGANNDRNIDRATYGIDGLYRWVLAVERQLQDIIGGQSPNHGWWADLTSAGAQSLRLHESGKLARNGTQTMEGDLLPDGDNTRDLGSAGAQWAEVRAVDAYVSDDLIVGDDMAVGGDVTVVGFVDAANVVSDAFTFDIDDSNAHGWVGAEFIFFPMAAPPTLTVNDTGHLAKSGTGEWRALKHLHLPHGATITGINCRFVLTINAATDFRFELYRVTLADGTRTILDSATYGVNQAIDLYDLSMSGIVINNFTYSYYLLASETGATKNAAVTIENARMTYTMPTVHGA